MQSVAGFLLTVALLVVVHEYGHYRAAVACGVKVLRFSVGFGRVIFSRRLGADRCEFAICALPLGGYVRMLDEREGPVAASDAARAFNRQPLLSRALITAAGPAANLLLAALLYAVVRWVGVEEPRPVLAEPPAGSAAARAGLRAGDWVQAWSGESSDWQEIRSMPDLRWALLKASTDGAPMRLMVSDRDGRGRRSVEIAAGSLGAAQLEPQGLQQWGLIGSFSEPVMGDIRKGGPADAAGLRPADRVLRVQGFAVADAASLRRTIRASPEQALQWEIERSGQRLLLTVVPRSVHDEANAARIGRINAVVGLPPPSVRVSDDAWQSLSWGLHRTWELSQMTVQTLGRMLIGEASLSNLAGPLTIADAAGQSASRGLLPFVAFLALVSVSIGVLNLLPLPMLDGGHLMYYFFEAVAGRPLPQEWLDRLQRGGVVVLLLILSVALFNDVVRLMGLQ